MAYGHYRNSGIPRLTNYAEALARYEAVKPIARRKKSDGATPADDRPLGNRKNDYYLIAKTDTGAIQCVLYGTPLVTFHPNGNLDITNMTFNSISTANFINDVLRNQGIDASIYDNSLVIGVSSGGYKSQRVGKSETITLKQGEDKNYHFVDFKPEVTHTINRKQTNIVRARVQEFNMYLYNMAKVRGNEPFTRDDLLEQLIEKGVAVDLENMRYLNPLHSSGKDAIAGIHQFKDWVTNKAVDRHEGYFKAMLMLVNSYGRYDWKAKGYVLDLHTIQHGLNVMLLGIYRDECLEAKATDTGGVKRDTYGKYFKYIWSAYHGDKS